MFSSHLDHLPLSQTAYTMWLPTGEIQEEI